MKTAWPVAVVALGVVLVLLGACWSTLFPPQNTWTEEKSRRLDELRGTAHQLMFDAAAANQQPRMTGGESAAELTQKYRQAQAELKQLGDEFQAARDAPQTAAAVLKWSGVVAVLAGAVAWKMTQA